MSQIWQLILKEEMVEYVSFVLRNITGTPKSQKGQIISEIVFSKCEIICNLEEIGIKNVYFGGKIHFLKFIFSQIMLFEGHGWW